jgi:hypothetical protein
MSPASSPLAAVADAESAQRFYAGISDEVAQELEKALEEAHSTSSAGSRTGPLRDSDARPVEPRPGSGSATPEPTLRWSSPRWRTSGIASATEYSTAATSEWPRDGAASTSSLSAILEEDVDPRYYLSPKAAWGILSRADKRGKAIPPRLREALEELARLHEPSSTETGGA